LFAVWGACQKVIWTKTLNGGSIRYPNHVLDALVSKNVSGLINGKIYRGTYLHVSKNAKRIPDSTQGMQYSDSVSNSVSKNILLTA